MLLSIIAICASLANVCVLIAVYMRLKRVFHYFYTPEPLKKPVPKTHVVRLPPRKAIPRQQKGRRPW